MPQCRTYVGKAHRHGNYRCHDDTAVMPPPHHDDVMPHKDLIQVTHSLRKTCLYILLLICTLPLAAKPRPIPTLVDTLYNVTQRMETAMWTYNGTYHWEGRQRITRRNIFCLGMSNRRYWWRGGKSLHSTEDGIISHYAPNVFTRTPTNTTDSVRRYTISRNFLHSFSHVTPYGPYLLGDHILSPFWRQNRRYYHYSVDTIGTNTVRISFRRKKKSMPFVDGNATWDTRKQRLTSLTFSGMHDMLYFTTNVTMERGQLFDLLPRQVDVTYNYWFYGNLFEGETHYTQKIHNIVRNYVDEDLRHTGWNKGLIEYRKNISLQKQMQEMRKKKQEQLQQQQQLLADSKPQPFMVDTVGNSLVLADVTELSVSDDTLTLGDSTGDPVAMGDSLETGDATTLPDTKGDATATADATATDDATTLPDTKGDATATADATTTDGAKATADTKATVDATALPYTPKQEESIIVIDIDSISLPDIPIRKASSNSNPWEYLEHVFRSHYIVRRDSTQLKVYPIELGYHGRRGVTLRDDIKFRHDLSQQRSISLNASIGYSFRLQEFMGRLRGNFTYSPQRLGSISFEAGEHDITAPNPQKILRDESQDDVRLYFRDWYCRGRIKEEIFNGFDMAVGFTAHHRQPRGETRRNRSLYNLKPRYRDFAPRITFTYTPAQPYYYDGNKKVRLQSVWPTFTLDYERGIKGFCGSTNVYEKWEWVAEKQQRISPLLELYWVTGAGMFTTRADNEFVQYEYFNQGVTAYNWDDDCTGVFQLLHSRYYYNSYHYWRGHVVLESPAMLLANMGSRVIRAERIYVNVLTTEGLVPYVELGYGVANPLLDLSAFTSIYHGMHFGVKFNLHLFD